MKRIIGLSALGILLLALVFGCTFPVTLDDRIQQFETDLNLAVRSEIYLNFHPTSTLNYDAFRDPTYFDISLPGLEVGDTPYEILIVDATNESAVLATIQSTAMTLDTPYSALFEMALDGMNYQIVSLQVDYGSGYIVIAE